jgi:hypothetical protein
MLWYIDKNPNDLTHRLIVLKYFIVLWILKNMKYVIWKRQRRDNKLAKFRNVSGTIN